MTTALEDITATFSTLAHVIPRVDQARSKWFGQLGGYSPRASGAAPAPGRRVEPCDCAPDDDRCDHNVELTGPEAIMAAAEKMSIDIARSDLRKLERLGKRIRRLSVEIDDLVTSQVSITQVTYVPDPKRPPQECDGNGKLLWCSSCWRNHGKLINTGKGYAEYCDWCGRFLKRNKALPTVAQLQAHHTGKLVRVRDQVTIRPRGARIKPTPAEMKATIAERQAHRLKYGAKFEGRS